MTNFLGICLAAILNFGFNFRLCRSVGPHVRSWNASQLNKYILYQMEAPLLIMLQNYWSAYDKLYPLHRVDTHWSTIKTIGYIRHDWNVGLR